MLKEHSSKAVVKNLTLHPCNSPVKPYFSFPNLPKSSHLPTQCNFMFSLSLSRKKKKKEKKRKVGTSKKFLKNAHIHNMESILCWPATPGHGDCPGVWPIDTPLEKLTFCLFLGIYCTWLLDWGGLCVHFLFVGSLCKHHDQQSVNPHEAGSPVQYGLVVSVGSNFESSTPSSLF